jgi:hypothetical protein
MTDHIAGVGSSCGFGVALSHLSDEGKEKRIKESERSSGFHGYMSEYAQPQTLPNMV